MSIDATFWVAIAFFIFFAGLIYLKVPQEILIVTMQHHQKYFPLFDNNKKNTSEK